ncbi:MAG: DUF4810 domain-containing protein [Muribaculaceae bacterium]|nr:DUF4810 domain-containing protein [Muribaculaceae bacterium]
MKTAKLLASCTLVLLLASCGSQKELYSWKDYEKASYAYTKEPTEKNEEKLIATYQQIIDNPSGARKVAPPGMCAELGYLYFKKGKTAQAEALLKKEVELYPESEKFIQRILDAIKK